MRLYSVAETFVNILVLRLFDAVKANSPHFYFTLPFKFDSKPLLLRPTLDTGSISLLLILCTGLHC